MANEEDSGSLRFFKDSVRQAVDLVPNFAPKEKLRAVQFWNQISEHLQVIVNNSAAEINALASYLQEQENNSIPIGSASNNSSTSNNLNSGDHHSIGDIQSEIPLLNKQNLDFDELTKQIEDEPTSNTLNQTPETIGNDSSSLASFDLPSQTSISMSSFIHPDTDPQCLDDINLTSIIDNNDLQSITSRTNEISSTQREPDLHLFNYDDHLRREDVIRSPTDHSNLTTTVSNPINSVPTSLCDNLSSSTHSTNVLNSNAVISSSSSTMVTSNETQNIHSSSVAPNVAESTITVSGKPFACSQCNQRFVSKSNLLVHEKLHTGLRNYSCDQCPARFSSSSNLKRHMTSHSGAKNFTCEHCGSKFTAKKTLAIHIRKHTGERPYKCNTCGKCFAQNSVWKAHLNTHTNEKLFECTVCGRRFSQKPQLRLHLIRHQGDRKWDCSVCQAKFVTKADLERHLRVHTGEKKFACELCGKCFTRRQTLNEHSNRHYGIQPWSCGFCNKQFSELSGYHKHIKVHKKRNDHHKPVNNANDELCYFEPDNFVNAHKNQTVNADACTTMRQESDNNTSNNNNDNNNDQQMFLDLDQIQQHCNLQTGTSMQDKLMPNFDPTF